MTFESRAARFRRCPVALAGGVLAGFALSGCAGLGHAPPLHEVETGLPGNVTEERAAFGIAEERRRPGGDLESAIRPFVVERSGPGSPTVRFFLPPLATQSVSDQRHRTTVWPLFSTDSVGDPAERAAGASDDDTMLLPLVGWGSEPGQDDWWMFFPVYGTLQHKLFSDEIEFAAFPLWARTRTGAWRSTHVLWPLIAWGEGEGRTHARFLPFWSQSDGPKGSKRSLLWPVVHWSTLENGDRTFDSWFVFPLVGHRAAQDGTYSEWTALWPFFSWSDDDRNGDRNRSILWPVHKQVDRPTAGVSSTWWWPLWGTYDAPDEASGFYAWPLVWTGERREAGRWSTHDFLVPLWMERESGPVGAAADRRELRSWPLFSFERTASGEETLRVPDLIPFFGWDAGETAWSDLLALFRWRADAEGRAAWDLPFGIVRWRRDAAGASKLTLLWWIDVPTGSAR